jgi:hypothetical protein
LWRQTGMDGALISMGLRSCRGLVASSSSDSIHYRREAEEMLLCEVIVQRSITKSTIQGTLMRVPCSRMVRSFSLSARQLPTDCFDIQALLFGNICDNENMVWLTRNRFVREMYTSVRRMDLQILCSRHCLETWRIC